MKSMVILSASLSLAIVTTPVWPQNKSVKEESDRQLLQLLLSTFLGANDLKNAFDVTKRGIQEYPEDPYWWEWHSKVSDWLGYREEAIKAKMKLLDLKPSEKIIKETLDYAVSANRFDYAVEIISRYPQLISGIKLEDLLYIYVSAGKIENFVKLLEGLYLEEKKPEYLHYLALANFRYGEYTKAEHYMKELEYLRPLNLSELMLYSDILNSQRKLKENYSLLKRYLNKLEGQPTELLVSYYKRLSSLAWLMKDVETSAIAAEVLDRMGKAEDEEYVRLYFYYSTRKDFEKAVGYARRGYEKSKDEYLFTIWTEGLSALRRWQSVIDAFEAYDRKRLLDNPYLLSVYAKALYMSKKQKEARNLILWALKERKSKQILSNSIYLAVSFNDTKLSKYILKNFKEEEKQLPREFALLYLAFQEGQKAKNLMDMIDEKDRDDLLIYSFALYTLGREEESNFIRSNLVRELSQQEEINQDTQKTRILLTSGVGILPAIIFQELSKVGEENIEAEVWLDIYLSYIFVNSFYERAEYLRNIRKETLKPWMELSLALRNNDREQLSKLLEEMADALPYRDVVEAYRRLGAMQKAMEHAQQSLEKNPEDALVYEQLRQLTYEYANKLQVGTAYRKLEKTEYITYDVSFTFPLDEKWYLLYSGEGGFLLSSRNPGYKNLPYRIHYNRLNLKRLTSNGYYQIGINFGKGLDSFAGLEFNLSRRLFRINSLNLSLYYNKTTTENLIAYVGLLKDGISLSAFKSITPRIGSSSSLEYSLFKSQDMKYIGSGLIGYADIFYKLKYAYPDYTFRLYTSFWSYEENDKKSHKVLNLYTYENPRVLPKDSITIGLGFNFGVNIKEMISRPILPFLDTEIYYNTDAGFGYGISLGLSGRLRGKDVLSAGMRNFYNFRTTGGSYVELFINYRINF
ncbi:MAG: tetratricopeptide repeat protein [Aquificaceae bacterium]|nr:tetratricopeptide repeat protein [Aquificaceae bacterium]MDW8423389.1 tetratricopeptide repeat protein [Aquificaceae bacterium]